MVKTFEECMIQFFNSLYMFCEQKFSPILSHCYAKYYVHDDSKKQLLNDHIRTVQQINTHLITALENEKPLCVSQTICEKPFSFSDDQRLKTALFKLIILGHDLGKSEHTFFESKKQDNYNGMLYRHELISVLFMVSAFREFFTSYDRNEFVDSYDIEFIIKQFFVFYVLIPILRHHQKSLFLQDIHINDIQQWFSVDYQQHTAQYVSFYDLFPAHMCDISPERQKHFQQFPFIQPHSCYIQQDSRIKDLYENNQFIKEINILLQEYQFECISLENNKEDIKDGTSLLERYDLLQKNIRNIIINAMFFAEPHLLQKRYSHQLSVYVNIFLSIFQSSDYLSSSVYNEHQLDSVQAQITKIFSTKCSTIKKDLLDKNVYNIKQDLTKDQQNIVNDVSNRCKPYTDFILQMPTGAGKTYSCQLISEICFPDLFLLYISPTRLLASKQEIFTAKSANDIFDKYSEIPEEILNFVVKNGYNTLTEDRLYLIFRESKYHLIRLFILFKCCVVFDEIHDIFYLPEISNKKDYFRLQHFKYIILKTLVSFLVPKIYLSATISEKIIQNLHQFTKMISPSSELYHYKSPEYTTQHTNNKKFRVFLYKEFPSFFSSKKAFYGTPYASYTKAKIGGIPFVLDFVVNYAHKNESIAIGVHSKRTAICLTHEIEKHLHWTLGKDFLVLCSDKRVFGSYKNIMNQQLNDLTQHFLKLCSHKSHLTTISFPNRLKCIIFVNGYVKFGLNITVQHLIVECDYPHRITQLAGRVNRGQKGQPLINPEHCSLHIIPLLNYTKQDINEMKQNISLFNEYDTILRLYYKHNLFDKLHNTIVDSNIFSYDVNEDSIDKSCKNGIRLFEETAPSSDILDVLILTEVIALYNNYAFENYEYITEFDFMYRFCDTEDVVINNEKLTVPSFLVSPIKHNKIFIHHQLGV